MIKSISIIVPTYNEEKFIKSTLERIVSSDTLKLKKEIIIVNDAAKGKTFEIVEKFIKARKYKGVTFKHIKNPKNIGKGGSVRKGFKAATGDLVMIQDADLEYDPADYPILIKPFFENDADVVYGSRFVTNRSHRVLYYWHFVANKMLTMLSNILTNLNFTDMETGYKLFKRSVIERILPTLHAEGFGIEAELTARIGKLKTLKIYEVGISYTGRSFEEGKVIGWRDGLKNIWEIIKYNLVPAKPKWLSLPLNKDDISELVVFPKTKIGIAIFIVIMTVGVLFRTLGLGWGINTDGIKHGSPYHDEGHTATIVFDKDFDKHFGEYEISKPVYFYRYIASVIVTLLRETGVISETRQLGPFAIYFLLRTITAIFGIASIYVVYLISKKVFNESWALFATLLYSLLPGQWFMSQLIKGEAIVTFFMPFSIYCLYITYRKGSLFWFILSGVVVGTALATKATFLVTLPAIFIVVMGIIVKYRNSIKKLAGYSAVALLTAFILFKTFYPYPFCCMNKFQEALQDPNNAFKRTSAERYDISPSNIYYIWTQFESKEFPFFTLAFGEPATYIHLLGLVIFILMNIKMILKKDDRFILISAMLITYAFFFISLNQYSGVNEDRYIVPFAPFIAILTTAVLYFASSHNKTGGIFHGLKKGILFTLSAGLIWYTFLFSIEYFVPFFKDPRTDLARWINSQTLPQESVLIYLPSSRDKIYTLKDKSLVYTYEERAEIESGKVVPDYIVLYKTINHSGRWGSLNFVDDVARKPYGEAIPALIDKRYEKIISFGERPKLLGDEKPETYITPTYDVYQKIK